MATSGLTTWNMTRDGIIQAAYRKLGVVADGVTASATQITNGAEALNNLIYAWHADGMPLWAIKEFVFNLTQGQNAYPIGLGQTLNVPAPLKIIQAYTRDLISMTDIPMNVYTHNDYNLLATKTAQNPQGYPIHIWYEISNQNQVGTIHLWPSPDAYSQSNRTVTIVYQRPFEDFNSSTDNPDFPQHWLNALIFNLADVLSYEVGLPLMDRNLLKAQAEKAHEEALSFGTEEGSLFLMPDWITMYQDHR